MSNLYEVTFYKKGFKGCKGEITQHIFADNEEDAVGLLIDLDNDCTLEDGICLNLSVMEFEAKEI